MFLTFTASVLLIQASSLPGSDETRPTHRFNLQDCIDYAIKNHTGLLNQRLNQAIYHKYLYEALGQYLPQVSAGATYQYNIKQQVAVFAGNTITIGTKQQFQGHIDVDQAIFSPSYIGSIGSGKLQLKIQDQNTQLTEIDLVVGVKKAYYGVLVAREQMTLFDANIKRSRKEMSDTRYKYENGLAQQVDIDRIQVLVNNAITQKNNAEISLQTHMQSLKYFMVMTVNDSLQVYVEDLPGAILRRYLRIDVRHRLSPDYLCRPAGFAADFQRPQPDFPETGRGTEYKNFQEQPF
ncbi:MAG: TolC family protein [Calditrichia bacterium]